MESKLLPSLSLRREVNTLETHSTTIISTSPILHTLASKSMTQATLLGFLLISACLSVCLPPAHLFISLNKKQQEATHKQTFLLLLSPSHHPSQPSENKPTYLPPDNVRLLLYPYTSVSNAPKQKI
jgi:hypothetical protein